MRKREEEGKEEEEEYYKHQVASSDVFYSLLRVLLKLLRLNVLHVDQLYYVGIAPKLCVLRQLMAR